jgi:hypothetical protein
VARGLAAHGDYVHVFTPAVEATAVTDGLIHLHLLPGRFDEKSRCLIDRVICRLERAIQAPIIVLVQYVPQAFGYRGVNLPFAWWCRRLGRRRWIMFHEVAFGFHRQQPLRHHLLAVLQRIMACWLVQGAARAFVSIPAWMQGWPLRRTAKTVYWLPVPSNLPTSISDVAVQRAKQAWPWPAATPTLGYFGSLAPPLAAAMDSVLVPFLGAEPTACVVLLGKGTKEFAREFKSAHPSFAGRVAGLGLLPADSAAAELAAVNLAIYPYLDGVSSRRTSLMAALALGQPILTTEGWLTEPIWRHTGAVELVRAGDWLAFAETARRLLADPAACARVQQRGRELYLAQFHIDRVISALRGMAAEGLNGRCNRSRLGEVEL